MFKKTTPPKDYGGEKKSRYQLPNSHTEGVLVVLAITRERLFLFFFLFFFKRQMFKLITNAQMGQYIQAQTLLVPLQGGIILGTHGCLSSTPT